jgi:hypothetical protein
MFKYEFNKYDVICLQEVWGLCCGELKEACKIYAQKCGFLHFAESPEPHFGSLFVADSGLMIFSKFPIVRSGFKRFRFGIGSDSDASRGVLFGEV